MGDDNYISFIKQVIADYKSNNSAEICNPQIRWDALKCVIRGHTIQYSSPKRRRLLMKQKSLEQKMQLLQNLLSYCLPNVREKLIENIQACQIELYQFHELETKEAMVRSRAKWFEKGETYTKYFLNLEKSGFD